MKLPIFLPIAIAAIFFAPGKTVAETPILTKASGNLSISPSPMPAPEWNTMGAGINGNILTMALKGNDLYVGGDFTNAGGIPDADYLARWDGCDWHAVVPGIDGCIYSIVFQDNILYAGGSFSGHVAKWNSGTWTVLQGITDNVLAIGINANGIYAAGFFTDASGHPDADGIARWNGTSWTAMGTGIELVDIFVEIATLGNDVYIAGSFEDAGDVPNTSCLAKWNGSIWSAVGGGLNGLVATIKVFETNIYVGGSFLNAGGNPNADEIARWDGSTWHNVGSGVYFEDFINTLCVSEDYIFTSSSSFGGGAAQMYRYDIQNNAWSLYPPDPVWADELLEIGGELYAGNSTVMRWGEPTIIISGVQSSICQDAAAIALPVTQSGYSGNWSGQGVNNNLFNPAGLLGWYPLTFTPNPGQCASPVTFTMYVYLNPVNMNLPSTICELSPPLPLTPYQNGYVGTWSGQGVTNNTFNPSGLGGYYSLTFTPNQGQCAKIESDEIYVETAFVPTIFGIPPSICEEDDPISLPPQLDWVFGNWAGDGVTNNTFHPSGLSGSVTLTFFPLTGTCAEPVSTVIFVNPFISITISGIPDSICKLASPISLPSTQSNITGNWSGQGVINNVFNPNGQNGYVNLSFTPNPGSCAMSTSTSLLVYINIIVLSGAPDTVCENSPPIVLSTNQNGFSGNWEGDGISNNIFHPSTVNGESTITFIPTPGQCLNPTLEAIFVEDLYSPEITNVPSSVCENSSSIELPVIQSGFSGNWDGPGVENNFFNPEGLNGQAYLIFTPDDGQCAVATPYFVFVQEVTVPLITGVPAFVCTVAGPVTLPTVQNGISGDWSGPGISNNVFSPSGLTGNFVLTFTPYPGQCATLASWNVLVDTSFVTVITDFPASVCQTDLPILLPNEQGGFQGSWTGPGISNDTFTPAGLNGNIQLRFMPNTNQCALPVEAGLLIQVPVHPVLSSLPDTLCQNDDPLLLLPIQDGVAGQWIGPGVDSTFFTPATVHGNILLSFVADNGACEDTTWTQLFVTPLPDYANLSITCDSVSNSYVVSFTISGGDTTGYLVDGIPIPTGTFTSAPIPFTSQLYSFSLEDGSDCAPVVISGSNSCICSTHAGTMDFTGTPLRVCKGPRFSVPHLGDQLLDPDDLLGFVMHDQSGNILGNVFANSDQPIFTFSPGMVIGQTYFISAVAGSRNGIGGIDLSDPCLSVSAGIPVVFRVCNPDDPNDDPAPPDTMRVGLLTEEGEVLHQFVKDEIDFNWPGQPAPFKHSSTIDIHALQEIFNPLVQEEDDVIKEFRIYDVYGRLVHQDKNLPGNQVTLASPLLGHTLNLIPGYYILAVEIENGKEGIQYSCQGITIF